MCAAGCLVGHPTSSFRSRLEISNSRLPALLTLGVLDVPTVGRLNNSPIQVWVLTQEAIREFYARTREGPHLTSGFLGVLNLPQTSAAK